MGMFTVTSSSVERVGGQLRFTPVPPDPQWMRIAQAASWVIPPILVVASIVAGDLDGLVILIGIFWALAALSFVAAKVAGRGKPLPPTEPFDVPEALVSEVRRLVAADRETEAIRAVRSELGLGLIDARRIVVAAARR
ncbi:MAG: hypothetical protein Q7T55_15710 [Solirubrobacteraceae bacterium]|nr:hypothetical protein [Solirubrobacteraceae bacterium]